MKSPEQREVITPFRSWAIFDLDGVVLRWTKSHTPNPEDQAHFLKTLKTAKEAGMGILVLTNRPPGQMAAIAYEFGVSYGVWVTESGGSLYDVHAHKSYVAPEWIPSLRDVRILREAITEKLIVDVPTSSVGAQFEPGMGYVKTVIVPPAGITSEEYAHSTVIPFLDQIGLDQAFTVSAGKAVDIDPVGLSKKKGMELLLCTNHINPKNIETVWIADHERDIPAAESLVSLGGHVASVGNAHLAYAAYVEQSGGIVAPVETSYHSSVSHILEQFLKNI